MQIKILQRTGRDLFEYLEMSAISSDRANEAAITDFVLIDGEPATLQNIVEMRGENLAILKGRVFSLQVKGIKESDDSITQLSSGITINKKSIKHNILEEVQLKTQKVKEKGGDMVAVLKSVIPMFYDIQISELEGLDYSIAAFMFNKINSFLASSTISSDEFDFDD
jgi:hypothetical protein